jgi:hypothetical protein
MSKFVSIAPITPQSGEVSIAVSVSLFGQSRGNRHGLARLCPDWRGKFAIDGSFFVKRLIFPAHEGNSLGFVLPLRRATAPAKTVMLPSLIRPKAGHQRGSGQSIRPES